MPLYLQESSPLGSSRPILYGIQLQWISSRWDLEALRLTIELVSGSPRQAVAAEVESVDSTPTDVERLTVQGLPDSEEHLTLAVMQLTDETELVMATTGCLIPAACKQTHITLCIYSNKQQFSSIHLRASTYDTA